VPDPAAGGDATDAVEAAEAADVVVVGAGVTGALVAWKLAAGGRRVVVLEAGPERLDRSELVGAFARSIDKGSSAPYLGTPADAHAPSPSESDRDGGHYDQAGPDPFMSTYERLAGGSTWHWLGNAPRLVPSDFRLRSTYGVGVDWPIGYDDLEPWYAEAERELGVAGDADEWDGVLGASRSYPFPMPPIWRSHGDAVVAAALDGHVVDGVTLRVRRSPQARNSVPYQGRPPCAGNSSCVPICPIAAKYDATVHLDRARRLPVPAEIRTRCVVTRLVPDGEGRIVGIRYDRWSEDGERRTSHELVPELVVLATHAIETPLLLLASGLARQGPVGLHLMDHPQGFGGAILAQPVFPFRGPPVISGIDELRDGPQRAERAAFRISVGNDGWGRLEPPEQTVRHSIFDDGLLGPELRAAVNHRVTRMLRMSYSTEMLPDPGNRVELAGHDAKGNPRPRLHFTVPDYNRRAFAEATALLERLFDRLGAVETAYSYPATAYYGAGHIMGTCRMGTDARTSVVDHLGRAHEHPNLWLVGAALFPTIGTANPTLTAAALALRTADAIAGVPARHSVGAST
jgi:choline dehydrogenase-like flavoprotein